MQIDVLCQSCGRAHKAEYYGNINIAEHPELKTAVLDGSLFTWQCEQCGQNNLLHYPLVYHDPQQMLMYWVSPSEEDIERIKPVIEGATQLSDYQLRIIDSPGELIEKIKIHSYGLDDLAMEICKYVTCNELEKDVELRFLQLEGSDSDLILTYPSSEQNMEMIAVGMNVYEDACAILSRNPEIKNAARGLVRVGPDLIKRFFR